jgi:hypothetical protein
MATNEELQAQIDLLREALEKIGGMRVHDQNNPGEASRLVGGPRLTVNVGTAFRGVLDRFDELRGKTS